MKIAVQPLYVQGRPAKAAGSEVWGELEISKSSSHATLVASLNPIGAASDIHVLPQLHDVHWVRLFGDLMEIRGYEKSADGWHLQVWSCRKPTQHEIVLAASKGNGIGFDPSYAQYVRWWPQLLDAFPRQVVIDVRCMMDRLHICLEEAAGFIEWLRERGSVYSTAGGVDGLGSITIKTNVLTHGQSQC